MVSILRLVWLVQLYYFPETDSTYDIRFVYVEIETCLAITAACGPALKPLFLKWFPQLSGSSGNTTHEPSKYTKYGTRTPITSNVRSTVNRIKHPGGPRTASFALKELRHGDRELRNSSPTGSEEEIMTYHGIMRTRDYTVKFASKEESVDEGDRLSAVSTPVISSKE